MDKICKKVRAYAQDHRCFAKDYGNPARENVVTGVSDPLKGAVSGNIKGLLLTELGSPSMWSDWLFETKD